MSSKVQLDAPRLWIVLVRCHRALSQIAARSIGQTGLGLSDFAALEALLHKGPLTITEIQGKVLLASGSMTAAVDRLEAKDLIKRGAAPTDRRAKVLHLTPKGRGVAEAAFGRHAAEIESAMSVLQPDEKRQLRALLKKLGLFAAQSRREAVSRNKSQKKSGGNAAVGSESPPYQHDVRS
jgi:MarR family transcriptional regulator, 2-MHQ and catechol-resistance regulon repressor